MAKSTGAKRPKHPVDDSDAESSASSSSSSSSNSSSSNESPESTVVKDNNNDNPSKKQKTGATTSSATGAPPPLELAPAKATDSKKNNSKSKQKIIVLLDLAKLETVKTRRGTFELLNCDDHRDLCRKHKKNPAEYRPDICHQELLALIDSPLNKAGHLQVYIKTQKNVLIEVHPSIRIPRTYKRFSGLIVQLLHKMKIKASNDGGTALMKVIKNPFSQYLPAGTHCYGMSCKGTLYSPYALARALVPEDPYSLADGVPPVCFVIGAMSTGSIDHNDHPYIEKMISISDYPLSGAAAIARILSGIEQHWGIV